MKDIEANSDHAERLLDKIEELSQELMRVLGQEISGAPEEPVSLDGIHPVVSFQKRFSGGKKYSYAAIGIFGKWYLTGKSRDSFMWTELMSWIGEDGWDSVQVLSGEFNRDSQTEKSCLKEAHQRVTDDIDYEMENSDEIIEALMTISSSKETLEELNSMLGIVIQGGSVKGGGMPFDLIELLADQRNQVRLIIEGDAL